MPKIARLALITGLALILLSMLVTAGVAGLLASERGTRWMAGLAVDRLGGGIRWESLRGSLWNRLEISGLEVEQPGMRLTADAAIFAWQPLSLLHGALEINTLSLADGRLHVTDSGDEAPSTGTFDPSALRLPLELSLDGVALDRVTLVMPDGSEQAIDSLALAAKLSGDHLELRSLALRLPGSGLSLSGSAGLRAEMPLELTLLADGLLPPTSAPGAQPPPQRVSAQFAMEGTIDWRDGIAAALSYRFSAQGIEGLVPDLPDRVSGSGRLSGNQRGDELEIGAASLALDNAPLQLHLHGRVSGTTTASPTVSAELQWKELRWPLTATSAEIFRSDSGRVTVAGSASDYRLAISADAAGAGLPYSRWDGRAMGDTRGLVVEALRGDLLDGWIEVSGPVTFDPQPAWDLRIAADGLDPASLLPEFAGPVEASLRTRGQLDKQGAPSAEINIDRLSASVADFPLELRGAVQLDGEVLEIASVDLRSGSGELHADGSLSAQRLDLNWTLAIADVGALVPGAKGRIDGEGRLSGQPEEPIADAALNATELGMDTLTVESMTIELVAGLAEDAPLTARLSVSGVREQGEPLLETLTVDADGSTAAHHLRIAVDAPAAKLRADLEGGLSIADSAWQGDLLGLDVESDAVGKWDLERTAPLTLATQQLRLEGACLHRRTGDGRLCLEGSWESSGAGALELDLAALPVEAFVPTLTGELSGALSAAIGARGALAADGHFELGSGTVRLPEDLDAAPLAHGGGRLALAIRDDGLRAEADFAAPADGRIDLELRLPALRAVPADASQPVEGRLRATLPDLAILAALAEAIGESSGQLSADLELAGSLEAPLLDGDVRLTNGAATLPLAGLDLQEIELRLAHEAGNAELLTLTGGLRSGSGRLEVTGSVDPTDGDAELRMRGEDIRAFATADARVQISPDLTLKWAQDLLRIRGVVTVPRAEITPRLQLGAATTESPAIGDQPGVLIGPSRDVVILGEEPQPGAALAELETPLRIDAEVGLILGRDVTVRAVGLVTRLEGAIGFSLQPDQRDLLPLARGGISLVDGTFRSFGQDLDIETGQVSYAGVPVTEPEIFLRAVRWIDSDPAVSAVGVQLSGPGASPELELFSRPQLDTTEIQSYLLTGTGTGENSSVLAIGTQLTERVYVGYGYNLLEQTSEFDALFSITPRYGLGADVGEADSNFNLMFTYEK